MKKKRLLKLNNQGSTFVLALMIITLVTTLAVAVLAASLQNLSMKNVDRNSKVTFYTADSVMDEVRASVGIDAMNDVATAYQKALSGVIQMNEYGYSYAMDNEAANIKFRDYFVEEVLKRATNGKVVIPSTDNYVVSNDLQARDEVVKYIQNHIQGDTKDLAKVNSVGKIRAYKKSDTGGLSWIVILEDVSVSYKTGKAGETYFADVTADLEIAFPNMLVDFSTSNTLNDFTNYSLIADTNINIPGKQATVMASIYAGNIISVAANGTNPGVLNSLRPTSSNINIICGGDNGANSGNIIVSGNADVQSMVILSGANIWCTNIVTGTNYSGGRDTTSGAIIQIDELCKSYVKDDLSVEGANTIVNLDGEYYGYSYDGGSSDNNHKASSAIIINGSKAKLNIGASRMILGGHAYVDLKGADDDYMLGESISFKGSQEVYLVPAKYLGKNYEHQLSNPMPLKAWEDLVDEEGEEGVDGKIVEICNLEGFFAKDYVNSTPYVVRKSDNGLVYLYLNFKSKDYAALYANMVVAGGGDNLKDKLNSYTEKLFEGNGFIKVTGGGSIYTKGAMLVTSNGRVTSTVAGTTTMPGTAGDVEYADYNLSNISNDEFVFTSMDLTNRYDIYRYLLADIPWNNGSKPYIVNNIDKALKDTRQYTQGLDISSSDKVDMLKKIVDTSWLESDIEYNPDGKAIVYSTAEAPTGAGEYYTKVIKDGNFEIPEKCIGGIIVATGTVTVKGDFHGLILAGRDIILSKDATFTTNQAMVEYLIKNEVSFQDADFTPPTVSFKNFFFAYKSNTLTGEDEEIIKVEELNYKDMVNFNNWRKYND